MEEQQILTCCICGKTIDGNNAANNPEGVLDEQSYIREFNGSSVCCTECANTVVQSGRKIIFAAFKVLNSIKPFETKDECISNIQLLAKADRPKATMIDFIKKNFDYLQATYQMDMTSKQPEVKYTTTEVVIQESQVDPEILHPTKQQEQPETEETK